MTKEDNPSKQKPSALSKAHQTQIEKIITRTVVKWLKIIGLANIVTVIGVWWGVYHYMVKIMGDSIAEQFKEPRISATVQAVAASESSAIITKIIQPQIDKFSTDLAAKVAVIAESASSATKDIQKVQDSAKSANDTARAAIELATQAEQIVNDANKDVAELKQFSDFSVTLMGALSYRRIDFDNLVAIGNDHNSRFSQLAIRTENVIIGNLEIIKLAYVEFPDHFWTDAKSDFVLDKATKEDFLDLIKKEPSGLNANSAILLMYRSSNLRPSEKIDILCEIIRNYSDISGVAKACNLMSLEVKKEYNYLGRDAYLKWWEDHRNEYLAKEKDVKKP